MMNMIRENRASGRKKAVAFLSAMVLVLNVWGGGHAAAAEGEDVQTAALATISVTHKLTMPASGKTFTYNGSAVKAAQPVIVRKGTSFMPVATAAKVQGMKTSYASKTKEVLVTGEGIEIRLKEGSRIAKVNGSSVTLAAPVFTYRGSMMVPIRNWAKITGSVLAKEGKALTLTWKKEEGEIQPPVAQFTTDKSTYLIGEPVIYQNTSYDENYSIVRANWKGNEPAFFEPGTYEITLEVENSKGVKSSVQNTVTVSDEVMHTREEFDLLYTPAGSKLTIDGSSVLSMDKISFNSNSDNNLFIRSNSPEHLYGDEGIAYEDTVSGKVRMNIHNQNRSTRDLSVYLIATNPNSTSATVSVGPVGIGGPTKYVSTSGKAAVTRYLEEMSNGRAPKSVKVDPGKSVILIPEMGKLPLKGGNVRTVYADVNTSDDIRLTVIVISPERDPIESLPTLPQLERDGRHIRGTFSGANRFITIDEVLGEQPKRLVLGDGEQDTYLDGVDAMTGSAEKNAGNTGVLYTIEMKVAANTLLALNARGGHYAGAFLVNDQVVQMTEGSILKDSSEAGVLYRTGSHPETVTLRFIPASGSNLPVNILVQPLPTKQ